MTENAFENHLKDAEKYRQEYKWINFSIATILAFFVGAWFGNRLFIRETGYMMNLFTEGLGIFVSVGLIGSLNKYIVDKNLRRSLIIQMNSQDNATALNAVRELWVREWTNLSGETFEGANLQSAVLANFNLQNCNFGGANLRNAILTETDFRGAILTEADLTGAILYYDNTIAKVLTLDDIKNYVGIKNDKQLKTFLHGEKPEKFLESQNKAINSKVLFDENTILPDKRNYREGILLAYYTDNDFPSGKFKPFKGYKGYRLAMHGFLNTQLENEYRAD